MSVLGQAANRAAKYGNVIYTSTSQFTNEIVDGARRLSVKNDYVENRVRMSQMQGNIGWIAKVAESSAVSSLHGLLRLGDNKLQAGTITASQIGMMHRAHREALRAGRGSLEAEYKQWQQEIARGTINHPGEIAQVQERLRDIRQEQAALWAQQMRSYMAEGLGYGRRFLQHTFLEGTTMDRVKKATAYGGIYMGANIIGRGLTGGGLTYNNDGERDIAGIPFV